MQKNKMKEALKIKIIKIIKKIIFKNKRIKLKTMNKPRLSSINKM